jgi:hypothetical protein
MFWKLFLDDERMPIDNTWVICRNLEEVSKELSVRGFPETCSLDHDLGNDVKYNQYDNSGMGVAKYLIDQILDNRFQLPKNFTCYVHSQNPVGKENIDKYFKSFIKHYKK